MHKTYITSSLFPQRSDHNAKKTEKKYKNKEKYKTKHEAPRSINHKAIQVKNNTGTTALERLVA